MSATGTPTPNLGLRIPLGTDPASVDDINYNSNALDTIIGDIGDTSVAGQLSAANNRISAVQDGLAIVCNGNTHAAIESGQFAYVKNHGTLAEGLYRNNTGSTIAANATLSSSNLTADSSGGLNTVYESLNSNLTNKLVYKACHSVPSDMTNHIYDTGVSSTEYICIGGFTPFDENIDVRISNLGMGNYRYVLYNTVTNTPITNNYNYWVFVALLSRSGLKEIT